MQKLWDNSSRDQDAAGELTPLWWETWPTASLKRPPRGLELPDFDNFLGLVPLVLKYKNNPKESKISISNMPSRLGVTVTRRLIGPTSSLSCKCRGFLTREIWEPDGQMAIQVQPCEGLLARRKGQGSSGLFVTGTWKMWPIDTHTIQRLYYAKL